MKYILIMMVTLASSTFSWTMREELSIPQSLKGFGDDGPGMSPSKRTESLSDSDSSSPKITFDGEKFKIDTAYLFQKLISCEPSEITEPLVDHLVTHYGHSYYDEAVAKKWEKATRHARSVAKATLREADMSTHELIRIAILADCMENYSLKPGYPLAEKRAAASNDLINATENKKIIYAKMPKQLKPKK